MATTRSLSWLALITTIIAALAGGCAAEADENPPSAAAFSLYGDPNAPDISGLWLGSVTAVPSSADARGRAPRGADGRPATSWAPWPLPYTPEYQKNFEQRLEAAKKGRALGDTGLKCLPFGLPLMLVSKFYPDEIVQTPGEVTILVFNTFPIVIWTDGRAHPKNLTSSYNGHSIGYWAGDTLVVDTVGINATTAVDAGRNLHSGSLHIRWTIQRVSKDVLHVHVTLYDAEAFTEPVTTTNIWHRKSGPEWAPLDDASCFENNHALSDESAPAGFPKLDF